MTSDVLDISARSKFRALSATGEEPPSDGAIGIGGIRAHPDKSHSTPPGVLLYIFVEDRSGWNLCWLFRYWSWGCRCARSRDAPKGVRSPFPSANSSTDRNMLCARIAIDRLRLA